MTIQSGPMQFGKQRSASSKKEGQPLKVLVLANLSGRSETEYNPQELARRKVLRVDKDSFDDVFARMSVTLALPGLQQAVRFDELEQLTPEYLYEHLSIFARYRQLVRNLKSKERFQEAVDVLHREGFIDDAHSAVDSEPTAERNPEHTGSLLDSVFGASSTQQQNPFSVDALIRETVAPYVEGKPDPRVDEYIAAVEHAASDLLRSVLHSDTYRSVESNWRSLDLFNRRVDTDNACHLYVLDVAQAELCAEAQRYESEPENGALFPLIDHQSVPGSQAYDVIMLGDLYPATMPFASVYRYLSRLATLGDATFISGVDFSVVTGAEPQMPLSEWTATRLSDEWRAMQNEGLEGIFCAPRYMVRLPYGHHTHVVGNLAFEELGGVNAHEDYLWGSSAYIMLLAIAQDYQRRLQGDPVGHDLSWRVDRLPLHVGVDEDGDEKVTPTTEAYLPEKTVRAMQEAGLTPVQSVKNTDSVLIYG